MAANLQADKVVKGDGNDHTPTNNFVNAVQASLNAIGGSLNSWASGTVFDPAKIMQAGAASMDWLAWDGAKWDNATPAATTGTVIGDTALTSAAVSFDFTAIGGSYKHLHLIGYLRSDRASDKDSIGVRFNGDSSAIYDAYSIRMHGTTPTVDATENIAATSAKFEDSAVGDTATANVFSTVELSIPHYASATGNKIFGMVASAFRAKTTNQVQVFRGVGAWRSNTAITQITLLPVGGGTNWMAGSRVVLYGRG